MYPVLTDLSNPNPENLSRGKLNEMVSCIVHEELNGDYSMTFEYPITGAAYKELVNGGTIRATAPVPHPAGTSDDNVSFDITKQSLPIDGIVTFTAQHVSRRLAGVTNTLLTIDGEDVDQVMRNCYPAVNTGHGYTMPDLNGMTFVSVQGGGVSGIMTLSAPTTCLSALVGSEDSLVSILGGDFSFKSDSNILTVYYETRRGADNGVSVRYGLNMTDIDMEKDTTGTFTAVVPYWDDGNGNITYASGYVVKPTTPISPVVAVPLDLSSEFDTQPTSAQLVTAARNYLDTNTPWVGTESIKVDLLSGNVQGFSSSDVQIGDTVHVYWGDADVAVDLRVVAYDYDVLTERYVSIELGSPQTEFVAVTGDASASGGGSLLNGLTYSTSGLSFSSGTILDGGYCKVGNLVIVNMRINVTTSIPAGNSFMSGFPPALSTLSSTTGFVAFASSNPNISVSMQVRGTLVNGGSGQTMSGAYMISGTYLCA